MIKRSVKNFEIIVRCTLYCGYAKFSVPRVFQLLAYFVKTPGRNFLLQIRPGLVNANEGGPDFCLDYRWSFIASEAKYAKRANIVTDSGEFVSLKRRTVINSEMSERTIKPSDEVAPKTRQPKRPKIRIHAIRVISRNLLSR